ncbi:MULTISPECIES: helix-turn-helix domain-containing protein [Paenibacillus]|uniref:Cro/C1-type HTH DNA-binding domain protein n=1 Tax=Paenibacillus macerans TaxID=44252 RepID=A0A090ZAM4_PAEMA|nr:helix-turn-helix transcriptional regulator [Paenibacillus macerans]KFN07265.1 cro/C1-type HTH DNA-binding domain protein [Paenibacillus macerans]MCY7558202.1 helix-turn-helix transcriptional regulator [Paenibacillus macerans]MEC0154660.1 helix-turn-helix transcriptional regulator [Paenibacillus macerans]SUA85607.1 Predicted transcriptional regulator [Paenibacillus macerans]
MLRLKLDKLLFDRRLNANQLSKLTGIRYPTILDMEANKSKAWSPENLNRIMIALDLDSVEELIEYVKEESTNSPGN